MPRKFQHKRRVIRLHSEQLEQRQLLAADTAILSLGEFASLDGSGNNLENPEYGSAGQPLLRMAVAEYSDGIASPAGVDRPNPRDISNTLSTDEGEISSRRLSAFAYVWGQFIDHDISRTPTGDEPFSIDVPLGDAYFDHSTPARQPYP